MEAAELSTWINAPAIPTGRLMFALKLAAENAREMKLKAAVPVITDTLRVAQATFDLEEKWARAKARVPSGDVLRVADNDLDSLIGGLAQMLAQLSKLHRKNVSNSETLAEMTAELFPAGVVDITGVDIPTELEKTATLLQSLRHDWKQQVATFDLGPWVDAIADAAATLSKALVESKKKVKGSMDWSEVDASQRARTIAMREFIAFVAGTWRADEPADRAARQALLGPLYEQIEAVRADYRRSRSPSDVTPEGTPRGVEAPLATTDQ